MSESLDALESADAVQLPKGFSPEAFAGMQTFFRVTGDGSVGNCATCHEPDGMGQGITYPALAGGDIPTGPLEAHIDRVMNGKAETEMQAWAPQLSDRELAAVITYERNAWGNNTADVVQPRTIYAAR